MGPRIVPGTSFETHISDGKIYSCRSFFYSLSLLLFNGWPFSLPLTRYTVVVHVASAAKGVLVSWLPANYCKPLHCRYLYASFASRRLHATKTKKKQEQQVISFFFFEMLSRGSRKFWYDRRKRSDEKRLATNKGNEHSIHQDPLHNRRKKSTKYGNKRSESREAKEANRQRANLRSEQHSLTDGSRTDLNAIISFVIAR